MNCQLVRAAEMSAPIVVFIPHRLGKAEASRRLREGFGRARTGFARLLSIESTTWDGDRVMFQVRALGQTAAGSIDVLEQELHLELMLPWFLEKLADGILPALQQEATLCSKRKRNRQTDGRSWVPAGRPNLAVSNFNQLPCCPRIESRTRFLFQVVLPRDRSSRRRRAAESSRPIVAAAASAATGRHRGSRS